MLDPQYLKTFEYDLKRGNYNLLLGAGVSLESKNDRGEHLEGVSALEERLCNFKGLRRTTLTRVYRMLTDEEKETELTAMFQGCVAQDELQVLTEYLWRRAFTFNIDDVVENAYETANDSKQILESINFDSPFEPTPRRDTLQLIHLHGFVREADTGYVFSTSEYASSLRRPNPWMNMLAQILVTESFVIAGTSLNEVDLEFFPEQTHTKKLTTRPWTVPAHRAFPRRGNSC